MDIRAKLNMVERSIESIATHNDEDADVRRAALDRIVSLCEQAKAGVDSAVQADINAQLGG